MVFLPWDQFLFVPFLFCCCAVCLWQLFLFVFVLFFIMFIACFVSFLSYCLVLLSPLYYPAGLRPRISLSIRHDNVPRLSPRCPTKLFLSGSLVALSRSHKALYTQFRELLPSHCMYWLTGCKTPSYLLTHCMLSHHVEGKTFCFLFSLISLRRSFHFCANLKGTYLTCMASASTTLWKSVTVKWFLFFWFLFFSRSRGTWLHTTENSPSYPFPSNCSPPHSLAPLPPKSSVPFVHPDVKNIMFCIAVYILYIYIWLISITHCVFFTWVFQTFVFCFFVYFFWLVVPVLNCIVIQSSMWMKFLPAWLFSVQRSAFLPAWLCVWERRERGRDGSHAGAARIQQRCDTNLPMFLFFFFCIMRCVCVWSLGPSFFFLRSNGSR